MDYAELVAVVTELIDDSGRVITVNRFAQTAADANKPWQGPGTAALDATDSVRAVFVPVGNTSALGMKSIDDDLLKRISLLCLVGPEVSFDVVTANEIVDGTTHYQILWADKLCPGDTILLYALGVAR